MLYQAYLLSDCFFFFILFMTLCIHIVVYATNNIIFVSLQSHWQTKA